VIYLALGVGESGSLRATAHSSEIQLVDMK